jgi:hypothetical protein
MKPLAKLQAREKLMAELAKNYAAGRQTIFHGTRHVEDVLDDGILYPSLHGDSAISFTRSAEIAAYFALLPGRVNDLYSGGVLVLDRRRLARDHRLERFTYEDDEDKYLHEQEKRVWDKRVVLTHLLIGTVTEADLDRIFEERQEHHLMGKVMSKDIINKDDPLFAWAHCKFSAAQLQRAREEQKAWRRKLRRAFGGL